jgi:hypothetical protein
MINSEENYNKILKKVGTKTVRALKLQNKIGGLGPHRSSVFSFDTRIRLPIYIHETVLTIYKEAGEDHSLHSRLDDAHASVLVCVTKWFETDTIILPFFSILFVFLFLGMQQEP